MYLRVREANWVGGSGGQGEVSNTMRWELRVGEEEKGEGWRVEACKYSFASFAGEAGKHDGLFRLACAGPLTDSCPPITRPATAGRESAPVPYLC